MRADSVVNVEPRISRHPSIQHSCFVLWPGSSGQASQAPDVMPPGLTAASTSPFNPNLAAAVVAAGPRVAAAPGWSFR